jgi:hypothetical protein
MAKYKADKKAACFPLAVYVVAGRKAQHGRALQHPVRRLTDDWL